MAHCVSAGVTTAAKATVHVGAEALKAAAPLGKWAVQQGFKLAVGAVARSLTGGKQGQQQQRQQGGQQPSQRKRK